MQIVIGPAMTPRLGDLYRAFPSVSVAAIRSNRMMSDLAREKVKISRPAKPDGGISGLMKKKLDLEEKNNQGLKG